MITREFSEKLEIKKTVVFKNRKWLRIQNERYEI